VVRETRGVPKMSVAVVVGDSDLRERARRTGRAFATRLVTDCVTSLVHALLQPLHTYFLAMAAVKLIMAFDVVV